MTGPTTLHERVADADRTRAIEPPPYRPGNPTWEAGYATAKAHAAELMLNHMLINIHPGANPYSHEQARLIGSVREELKAAILAMRPTAPKVTA